MNGHFSCPRPKKFSDTIFVPTYNVRLEFVMATARNFWYENYTMLFDFYEMTMGNGYLLCGKKDQICYFDMFFRSVPMVIS